jgi:carbon monoxide dehydrogenase subunit G
MDLTHSFTVPVDRATAWAAFQDIESVAECFPGAAVTSVEGDTFEGTCKVKLGPIALQYSGSGAFLERDAEAFRMLLEAKGKDRRGNGTAGATVTTTFLEEGPSSTRVEVVTDLNITGKPAQFGRGVMQDVSDKLLGQFVSCLEARVGPPPAPQADSTGGAAGASEEIGTSEPGAVGEAAPSLEATQPMRPVQPAGEGAAALAPPVQAAGAIDLGTTVLPALARAYWKPLAGIVLVLLVLRWLRRR